MEKTGSRGQQPSYLSALAQRLFGVLHGLLPHQLLGFLFSSLGKLTLLSVLLVAIVWSAAFAYVSFYYSFIPVMHYRRRVDLLFDTRCVELCAEPHANLTLLDRQTPRLFARGQAYRIAIGLHLPESELNWAQGTFMVRLRLLDAHSAVVAERARSAILKYKSPLIRVIGDLICWPLLLLGLKEDAQHVQVELFDDYIDQLPPAGEAVAAQVHIEGATRTFSACAGREDINQTDWNGSIANPKPFCILVRTETQPSRSRSTRPSCRSTRCSAACGEHFALRPLYSR